MSIELLSVKEETLSLKTNCTKDMSLLLVSFQLWISNSFGLRFINL